MMTKLFGVKMDLKNLSFQGPWGDSSGGENSGSNAGQNRPRSAQPKPRIVNPGNNPGNNQGRKQGQVEGEIDLDEMLKKAEGFIKGIFSDKKGGSGGGQGGESGKAPKSAIVVVVLSIISLWLASGIYKINSDQNGVVLYFGKFYSIATPGLNYHIPFPFGKVIKKSVTTVNIEEFGFSTSSRGTNRDFEAESLMLTGDENIVDVEFQVQWQISDVKDYIFNIAHPHQAIRKTAESAMREVIARTPIASALSDGKKKIEIETKDLLQQVLDYYGTGVRIVTVQMRRVDPPSQVIDAFRDVQTAKADKEKEINQAQSYSNDIIPRARGLSAQMSQQAEAFRQEVIANAQGEAGRFMSVYRQYSKAKRVTRKRIYLETMEEIYRDADKVFIDKNASKSSVMPYFPLNDLPKQKSVR